MVTEDEVVEGEHVTYMARLRWAEMRPWDSSDLVVRGIIPGYPENGPTYYKLQQLCVGADGQQFWQNVEIES